MTTPLDACYVWTRMRVSILIGVLALLVLATGCRPSVAETDVAAACQIAGTYDLDQDGICFGDPAPGYAQHTHDGAPPIQLAIAPAAPAMAKRVGPETFPTTKVLSPPRFISPDPRPPNAAAL